MKKKDSDIEFYRETLARLQQEKASYAEENRALRDEIRAMLESHRQETEGLRQTLEAMRLTMLDQARSIKELTGQLTNAMAQSRLSRGKRFAPTTEQTNLMNNRRSDTRAEEKDDFDGNPPSAPTQTTSTDDGMSTARRARKKSQGRKPAKEDYRCDETVRHPLGSYFNLPGGSFKTRNCEVEIHHYESYEYVPGRVIKHVWETATYIDPVGDSHNTLPPDVRENPVKGCPFSPEMLAFILVEIYAYHTPKNRIKRKLREMGACFSKSNFIRSYQLSEKALRDMLEPAFREAVTDCQYLMIDQTCELVGVIDPQTNIAEYLKKYLWAFHNKAAGLVWYMYENGSRAREVVGKVLRGFRGTFTTDGYAAYTTFGNRKEHPDMLHCGCLAHVRRYFIEALGVASEVCHKFIDEIELLFANERLFKNLPATERAANR